MPRLESTNVPKLWGSEQWIVNNDKYCGKLLTINPDYQCSLHYHAEKDETFFVLSGRVLLEVHEKMATPAFVELQAGDAYQLLPGTPHRFRVAGDSSATIIEFSTHHRESDVTRLEESRKL